MWYLQATELIGLAKIYEETNRLNAIGEKLLVLKWHDKRDVSMLITVHTPTIVNISKKHHATGEIVCKPECVESYTKNVGAVDKTDMQIILTECTRKTRKW